MNIKTYTELDEFPSDCWFADYQPTNHFSNEILEGDVTIRKRDNYSTRVLFTIPIGGSRGIEKKKANKIVGLILTELNK